LLLLLGCKKWFYYFCFWSLWLFNFIIFKRIFNFNTF